MKITSTANNQFRSTYSLLVGSEEKGRNVLEIAVYGACILSVVFTIWQFAQTPLPTSVIGSKPCVACQNTKSDLRTGI